MHKVTEIVLQKSFHTKIDRFFHGGIQHPIQDGDNWGLHERGRCLLIHRYLMDGSCVQRLKYSKKNFPGTTNFAKHSNKRRLSTVLKKYDDGRLCTYTAQLQQPTYCKQSIHPTTLTAGIRKKHPVSSLKDHTHTHTYIYTHSHQTLPHVV